MKVDRNGQSEIVDDIAYRAIRECFLTESHQLFFDIAHYTGERPGAILQLGVYDVYSNPNGRVPRSTIVFRALTRKDETTREVPCSEALTLKLRAYRPPTSGWLFPSLIKKGDHLTLRAIDRALRRALYKAGLAKAGYSLYGTRRGFLTGLMNRGVSLRVIQSLSGHKSLEVLSRYLEVTEEQRRSAVELI